MHQIGNAAAGRGGRGLHRHCTNSRVSNISRADLCCQLGRTNVGCSKRSSPPIDRRDGHESRSGYGQREGATAGIRKCRREDVDDRYRIIDCQCHCSGCRRVVDRIGWSERDTKRVISRGQYGPRRRSVHEASRNRCCRIQLRRAQCRRVDDRRRRSPGDRRHCLVHRQLHVLRGRRIVGRVGRRKGYRERLRTGAQHRAQGRTVVIGSTHVGGGIELRRAQRCPVSDRCRCRPGDKGCHLADAQRPCCVGHRVVAQLRVGIVQRGRDGIRANRGTRRACRRIRSRDAVSSNHSA